MLPVTGGFLPDRCRGHQVPGDWWSWQDGGEGTFWGVVHVTGENQCVRTSATLPNSIFLTAISSLVPGWY